MGVFESRWPGVVGRLITGRFPMDQAPALLTGAPAGGIKSVVAIGE